MSECWPHKHELIHVPKGNMRGVHFSRVVRTVSLRVNVSTIPRVSNMQSTDTLDDPATTCRSKCFNCIIFPFLHLGWVIVLHQKDGLPTMDLIAIDGVPTEIFNDSH